MGKEVPKIDNIIVIKGLQKNLKRIRQNVGWDQHELADLLHLSRQTIINLEKEKTKMTPLQFLAIIALLEAKQRETPGLSRIIQAILEKQPDTSDVADPEPSKLSPKPPILSTGVLGGLVGTWMAHSDSRRSTSMAYRHDQDLDFLQNCETEDLDILVKYLIQDKDGSPRLTESLTSKDRYKENEGQPQKYWDLIAEELQHYGGNTIANMVRGSGVSYREILIDVCEKMKVNFNSKSETSAIEINLLQKILTDALGSMSAEELKEVIQDLDLKTTDYSKQAIMATLQGAIVYGKFQAYKIALIVANAVAKQILGRGLTLAANAALTRGMSLFAGPIGWALTAAWTIIDAAGPAYRVTIPAVIQVAYMRLKMKYGQLSQ